MSVLVTTADGYHIFTSSGKHLTALDGHRVRALHSRPRRHVGRDRRPARGLAARARRHVDCRWRVRRRPDVARRRRRCGVRGHVRRATAPARRPGASCRSRASTPSPAATSGTRSARAASALDDRHLRRPGAPGERARRRHPAVDRLGADVGPDDRGRRRRARGACPPHDGRTWSGGGLGRLVRAATTAARPGRSSPTASRSRTHGPSPSSATTSSSPSPTARRSERGDLPSTARRWPGRAGSTVGSATSSTATSTRGASPRRRDGARAGRRSRRRVAVRFRNLGVAVAGERNSPSVSGVAVA